jgi:hypothetical protein
LQIAERLGLQRTAGFRGVTDWLDVLVSLDNLVRSGEHFGGLQELRLNTY